LATAIYKVMIILIYIIHMLACTQNVIFTVDYVHPLLLLAQPMTPTYIGGSWLLVMEV